MDTPVTNRFVGSSFLVVGASSGIGEQVALRLLDEGAAVYVWNRRPAPDLADRGAVVSTVDVSSDFDPAAPERPEILHGVVYAPGTINLAAFARLSPAQFLDDYNVNVVGAVRVLQAVQKELLAADGASVVLFSSVAARTGMHFHTSIAAAKAGVEGLAVSLAAELAPRNLRVNVVAPSLTDTPLAAKLLSNEKRREASAERHPLKRIGSPSEVASLVTWLLGSEAGWVTGQTIGVDGGLGSISGL